MHSCLIDRFYRYQTFIQKMTTPQNYINFEDNIIINNVYNVTKSNLIKSSINLIVLNVGFIFLE